MIIQNTEFVKSSRTVSQCPIPNMPEFAFIGRSNVGKSSLINMLAAKKGLAKISGTPGKTRLINHFLINNAWYLVDLPGYGFAKVSKYARASWEVMISKYFGERKNLGCTFLLIDIRIEPQKMDIEFMDKLAGFGIPFVILFTKSDKLTKNKLAANANSYRAFLQSEWEQPPVSIVTSSATGLGKEEVLNLIELYSK
jgi:GTP-binding protein